MLLVAGLAAVVAAKHTAAVGFHEITVLPDVPVAYNLEDQFAIVFFPPIPTETVRVEYIGSGHFQQITGHDVRGPVRVPCKAIRFTAIGQKAKILFWIIPNSICPLNSIVVTAENQIDFSAENQVQEFPVCIFTQSEAKYYQMAIVTHSNSSSAIRYYPSSMKDPVLCSESRRCKYRSMHPFFSVITGEIPEGNFSMKISYRINPQADFKAFACSVRPLPRVTDAGVTLPNCGIGEVSVLCTSSAQESMDKVVSLLLTVLVTVGVLFVIHFMGVLDIFRRIGSEFGGRKYHETEYVTLL
jgi:hypothetical protein